MLVVAVGEVSMPVPLSCMAMTMRVGLVGRITRSMLMLVMHIMGMTVAVLNRVMLMIVFVSFRQMQPNTEGHQ